MGNLRSVAKALAHVAPDRDIVVSADAGTIRAAERVVLPGQSAMPDCMKGLVASGLVDTVRAVLRDRPFLGICLGLQMLFDDSEEGPTSCLAAIPGRVVRFREEAMVRPRASGSRCRTWGGARSARRGRTRSGRASTTARASTSPIASIPFPRIPAMTAATVDYPAPFTCAIARANIFATQFHPEKSQRAGLTLLANFVTWDGRP